MSSSLPSASSDYAAPAAMVLNKAAWDAALVSIGIRLRAVEAVEADFQAAIDQLEAQGLNILQQSLAPQLVALQEIITGLEQDVATAEAAVAVLLASGIPAANVTLEPTGSIAAVNVQAALAELASEGVATGDVIALTLALG